MASRAAAVTTEGFGWHYPNRSEPAFRDVTLEIPPGQKVLLLGPSGAGKSTLLHALAGVLDQEEDPALGTALIDGLPAARARGRVGLMQQDPEASIVLSRVGQDLAFGPENLGVPREQIRPRCEEALAAVGLDLDWERPTSALSGGQKQRLGLAGILAMRPGLLLLDEPTANLDPAGVEEVRDAVLRAVREYGSTLVVVEHRVGVWAPHVDRVIVLRPAGGISHDGAPEEVLGAARRELIHAGVWVPGHVPVGPGEADGVAGGGSRPAVPGTEEAGTADAWCTGRDSGDAEPPAGGERLLAARDLAVTRTHPQRRWARVRRRAAASSTEAPPAAAAEREPWARTAPVASRGIDLTLRAGQHLAVVGPNGAGKSTLALTLAGLQWPAAGLVVAAEGLRGDPGVSWDPMCWSSPELIRRIGTVFQEPEHQFVKATVAEELELGARLSGAEDPGARAEDLLERLRLDRVAEANPFTLSGGEKRRLSVGTALAARPRVLVLDEPTFGQDAITWARLVRMLGELMAEGTAVVSVTHDLDFAAALGGRRLDLGAPEHRPREADDDGDARRGVGLGEAG